MHLRAVPRVIEEADVAGRGGIGEIFLNRIENVLMCGFGFGENVNVLFFEAVARDQQLANALDVIQRAFEIRPTSAPAHSRFLDQDDFLRRRAFGNVGD